MDVSHLPWTVLLVTAVGAVAIVVLALLIGVVESRSRQQAWRRIADARRMVSDRNRTLDERGPKGGELLEALDGLPLCPECSRLLRQMSEEDNRGITH